MSLFSLNIEEIYEENKKIENSKENIYKYGEIYTPFSLIRDMFKLFDVKEFKEKDKKWLDTGAGVGNFSIYLYSLLMDGLNEIIPNKEERHNHIIKKMIYMVEIKENNVERLREIFGKDANIYCMDYTEYEKVNTEYDYIIGNPPYNSNGIKKVPTNTELNKKMDGKTIWVKFIYKSISLLVPKGKLLYIIPSIWMKPDKAGVYDLLVRENKIKKISTLTNTENNKLFEGNAQTPTCYFLLSKEKNEKMIEEIYLYSKHKMEYMNYVLEIGKPIPVYGSYIINKINRFVKKYGCLIPNKTNLPSKDTLISLNKDEQHPFVNIKTCLITEKNKPKLVIEYTNKKQSYHGIPKLILAHKMYGFPYLDELGEYGISNRDNYVIYKDKNDKIYSLEELKKIQEFLSTKFVLYVYESTRYRMKYLEKYAFEFLPDVTKMMDIINDSIINDELILKIFGLDEEDKREINSLHKKDYEWFIGKK